MINRKAEAQLRLIASQMPVTTVTGPRQSGKTTLCRAAFSEHRYFNFENPDTRQLFHADPRRFLEHAGRRVIFDEFQRVPDLPSYLQQMVDEDRRPETFILTGSQNLSLSQSVGQSLAGRTGLLKLFPLSLSEILETGAPVRSDDLCFEGFFPSVHAEHIDPAVFFPAYIETYLERDLRQLSQIQDLSTFVRFLKLCASHVAQLVDFTALGEAAGIDQKTARRWLSLLEATYTVFLLPSYSGSLKRRLVKTPKLYFFDVGLASALLDLRRVEHVATHPLRGALFENLVISDLMKESAHLGLPGEFLFYRDHRGLEVDLLIQIGTRLTAVEIKSAQTFRADSIAGLHRLQAHLPHIDRMFLVYDGSETLDLQGVTILPLPALPTLRTSD